MLRAQTPEAEARPRMYAEGGLDSGRMAEDEEGAPESTPRVQDEPGPVRAGRSIPFGEPEETRVELRQRVGGVDPLGGQQQADCFRVLETLDRVDGASSLASSGQGSGHALSSGHFLHDVMPNYRPEPPFGLLRYELERGDDRIAKRVRAGTVAYLGKAAEGQPHGVP